MRENPELTPNKATIQFVDFVFPPPCKDWYFPLGELSRSHQRGMLEDTWKLSQTELRRRMAELTADWEAEGEPTADIVEDGHEESMTPSPPTRAPSRSGGGQPSSSHEAMPPPRIVDHRMVR